MAPTDAYSDLLDRGPLHEIRFDLTTRCNLRCVYCAVSQPDWQGADMPIAMAERAATLIGEVTANQILPAVHMNGHGETTFLDNWTQICRQLLARKIPLVMTTNLAKQFSSEEFQVLAQMDTIMVSIDTADPELLRRLRRRVSLARIVQNINEIRNTAARLNSPSPNFRISCGLYDQNTLHIEGLAEFAVEHRMKGVGFWNLSSWSFDKFPYDNTDVPLADRAYPLDDLDNDQLRPRLEAIRRAIEILRQNEVEAHIHGDFIANLSGRLESAPQRQTRGRSHDLPEGMTRDCLDPWIYLELNVNGDVQPCCAHSKVGNLNEQELPSILNGPPIRQLRQDLLYGTPDAECANCRLRAATRPEALRKRIRMLFEQAAKTNYAIRSGKVQDLLSSALADAKAERHDEVWPKVQEALLLDPGIDGLDAANIGAVQSCLQTVLDRAQFPLTFTWLAGILTEYQDNASVIVLLSRYLELAPHATDKDIVLQGIRDAEWRMELARRRTPSPANRGAILLANMWKWTRTKVRLRSRARSLLSGK
jgi:MoaA/NifB/PqqE/SkfB family radical SAM enzyme